MATLIERAIGAARLDVATYEEVEHDPDALGQAMTVVVAAALASGVGSAAQQGMGALGLVLGAAASLLAWFVWAGIVYGVGTKLLPAPDTKADLGQLLRTTGFAAAPGVLGLAGVVPGIGIVVVAVAGLWQLATMVVAVRQALDYPTTSRAIAVCLVGFVVYVLIVGVALVSCVTALQGGASGSAIG